MPRTPVDFTGVLVLYIQNEQLRENQLHKELEAMDNVLRRQVDQYQQSKESIYMINRQCHDLKMKINALRMERDPDKREDTLNEITNGLQMYEAQNKTGNAVPDTLLTAKSLCCQQHDITFTCVADGHPLDFLSTEDLCTIVGTLLDNATESVVSLPQKDQRLIRTAIYARNGFVMVRCENYCEKEVPLGADGLPEKPVRGGYGLKSIRAIVQKYGGSMTIHAQDSWFTVRVLLPRQNASAQ